MKALVVVALLMLGACADTAIDRGRLPPIQVVPVVRRLPLGPGGRPDAVALNAAVLALHGNSDISADIMVARSIDAEVATMALVRAGIDPDRVHLTLTNTSPPGVILTAAHAVTTSCDLAWQADGLGNAGSSVDSIGRCVQQNNLAEMLADPMDLIRSPTPQPGSGERSARAIRLLNQGGKPLPAASQTLASGLTDGGSSAPAVTTTGATQANPLLGGLSGANATP